MKGVIKVAEEQKRRLYIREEDPRDSHSLHLLFFLSAVQFAFVAIKNVFTSINVKHWWAIGALIIYTLGVGIFLLRLVKSNKETYKKNIDIAMCIIAVALMTDIVFEYSFLDIVRPWIGNPIVIVIFGVFFMLHYRVYPDIQAGIDASKKQAEERQKFLKDEMKKHKKKKKKEDNEE